MGPGQERNGANVLSEKFESSVGTLDSRAK